MELHYKINWKIFLLALFGVLMLITSYFMFIYEPIQLFVKKLISLSPGSLFYFLWSSPPYKVYINLYIFTITNHEKFMRGEENLNVKEIGPYCYQEILRNTNAVFHSNGTVTYTPVRYLKFIPERSVGDPNKDRLISINIPLVGISALLRDSSMFTNLGLTMISNTANSKSILNVTVHEYLFGYEDLLVKLANTALPNWINFKKFGIFDRIMALDNSSNVVTLTTDWTKSPPTNSLYSTKETKRNFYIQQFNGSPGLHHWGYEDLKENETNLFNNRCNFIGGAFDGTLFPRDLTMNDEFRLYRRAFCRPVPAEPVREIQLEGFDGIEYKVKDDFLSQNNPDNLCYCKDNVNCLPDGLVSIAPCYFGIPVTISLPHFHKADPKLLTQVSGLTPDKDKHESRFVLDKKLGVPIKANLRIQVNLDVGQTKYNAKTLMFNNLHIPLCWLELQVDEVPTSVKLASFFAFSFVPIFQEILKYLTIILGFSSFSLSSLLILRKNKIEQNFNNLPFSQFSLRRSSEYKTIPIIDFPENHREFRVKK